MQGEAIAAAVQAHGDGKILASEMPIARDTRDGYVRYAPSFSTNQPAPDSGARPYTVGAQLNRAVRSSQRGIPLQFHCVTISKVRPR